MFSTVEVCVGVWSVPPGKVEIVNGRTRVASRIRCSARVARAGFRDRRTAASGCAGAVGVMVTVS